MPSRTSTVGCGRKPVELIEQAERLHRQFFRICTQPRAVPVWEPPSTCSKTSASSSIIVALPGVTAESDRGHA